MKRQPRTRRELQAAFAARLAVTGPRPDRHGNVLAAEGCDRCPCGAKYWENDRCVSCGAAFTAETVAV